MATRMDLVVIDPQNDFCVPNGTFAGMPTGALLVPGAHEDMKRLSKWVKKNRDKIGDIHVTLDSHHRIDVAHKWFWRDRNGNHPLGLGEAIGQGKAPTIISSADVKNGVWTPFAPSLIPRMIAYTEALEKGGKYPLIIWDDHCLIGTPGAAVVPELMEALDDWTVNRGGTIDFVTKGSNVYTEHYGAFAAEVPDPEDPTTQLNTPLIKTMETADVLVWAGEAATHCVLNSMRQAFENFGKDSIAKSVLLVDAMSCIPSFETNFQSFLTEYQAKGLKVAKTTQRLSKQALNVSQTNRSSCHPAMDME